MRTLTIGKTQELAVTYNPESSNRWTIKVIFADDPEGVFSVILGHHDPEELLALFREALRDIAQTVIRYLHGKAREFINLLGRELATA